MPDAVLPPSSRISASLLAVAQHPLVDTPEWEHVAGSLRQTSPKQIGVTSIRRLGTPVFVVFEIKRVDRLLVDLNVRCVLNKSLTNGIPISYSNVSGMRHEN